MTSVLTDGVLADGRAVDITISDGLIASVDSAGTASTTQGVEVIELGGRLVAPAFGEPHAHLDKAYLADIVPNPAGDLTGAVDAINEAWPQFTVEDIADRAADAARRLVAAGTTAIRTHVDLVPENGDKSVRALLEVKEEVAHLCDLQVVALTLPVTGEEGRVGRMLLDDALQRGADVVGTCPHLDEDPLAAIDIALDAAVEYERAVDVHFDEELDVTVQHLPELVKGVEARGLGGKVAASHCVSHGLLDGQAQRDVGKSLADAGVAVITNPRTNLFLQARGIEKAQPRGLAGVRALLDSGVTVAAGADNVQDPFYIIGRSDPLETATFLVTAAHLTIDEAWTLVGPAVREVLNLAPVSVAPGAPAELVAVQASSIREAIADQPPDRIVFHRGNQVARTTSETWVA